MSKKHFIALADSIRPLLSGKDVDAWRDAGRIAPVVEALAAFCRSMNPRFDRARWVGYVYGDNGPSGGRIA